MPPDLSLLRPQLGAVPAVISHRRVVLLAWPDGTELLHVPALAPADWPSDPAEQVQALAALKRQGEQPLADDPLLRAEPTDPTLPERHLPLDRAQPDNAAQRAQQVRLIRLSQALRERGFTLLETDVLYLTDAAVFPAPQIHPSRLDQDEAYERLDASMLDHLRQSLAQWAPEHARLPGDGAVTGTDQRRHIQLVTPDPEAVDPEAVDPEAVDPEAVDPEAVTAGGLMQALHLKPSQILAAVAAGHVTGGGQILTAADLTRPWPPLTPLQFPYHGQRTQLQWNAEPLIDREDP